MEDPKSKWQTTTIDQWYGQKNEKVELLSGISIRYKSRMPPVPNRWVLIRDPQGQFNTVALLCTDLEIDALEIVRFFIQRWTVEVTFEEVRKHLGVESQRQWFDLAIARSTPILLPLFSSVTLWADQSDQEESLKRNEMK
ncbi:hypothetical protein CRP01_40815 [Flavilitoribacter nigricans DSM 23189 = NBRC 102662]|uniref:Transposase IS4-like domain-containing protein n=1 Tax=Flavilitoribacter nigricans (strain ATCC 23147 / DSM 23189 / NBRC 102662 / NCIMB 1420 / SS-2) TaxID=1122177 RepID=A0A2D0MX21_FLAN2|nr:hypothetical protein CRP01_40815 [Flavilitoribacter nigricans DSM 23189 = NBRC 102662]